jgi:NitT/TauT family transport system ATP-binding protein
MPAIIELEHVTKIYPRPQGGDAQILADVSMDVMEGEVLAIVGPSGCGKSTLLRIIHGLIPPSAGAVRFAGRVQTGINLNCGMVFQSFALLPWLTVEENVEVGLEARGLDEAARRKRAGRYIDKVGLDGNEDAYPRELSGGMKQRVGLARALAVEPTVLLMDEPFSALDALTSINLREELLDLWADPSLPVDTIVIVTHIIEEAVELADRIVVLASNPGRMVENIKVDLPRPRDKKSPAFTQLVDRVFSLIV